MILYKNITKRHNASFPFFPINIGEFKIEQLQNWIKFKTSQPGFLGSGLFSTENTLTRFDVWKDLDSFNAWQKVKEDYSNALVRMAVFDWYHILSTLNYETHDSHQVEEVTELEEQFKNSLILPLTAETWSTKFKEQH